MQTVRAQFSDVSGTEAALGWAGDHTIVADRPEGKAGGMGLGFNGAQMLALALGACLCNDLRYIADRRRRRIGSLTVDVALHLDGDPIMAISAEMTVHCTMEDGSDGAELIAEARRSTMVGNSLARGVPVSIAACG